jgi:hypothetical protein
MPGRVEMAEGPLREALSEIAGIASQRGSSRDMFGVEDHRRLGEIERLARKALSGDGEDHE